MLAIAVLGLPSIFSLWYALVLITQINSICESDAGYKERRPDQACQYLVRFFELIDYLERGLLASFCRSIVDILLSSENFTWYFRCTKNSGII